MSQEQKISLNISGMTCVNCSNAVEKVTKKMKGVSDASVNFTACKGEFVIDTSLVDKKQIVSKIEKLGYSVADDVTQMEAQKQTHLEDLRKSLFIAAFFTVLVSIMEKSDFIGSIEPWLLLACASIVQFYCGGRFYSHAFSAILNRNYDMNVLVALGTSAAYGYSALVVLFPDLLPDHMRYVYFMGSTVIITFILLGKFLEERSKSKATDFLKKLMNLSPQNATKLTLEGEQSVAVGNLSIGDIVVIRSGEKVCADGQIIHGHADIDTSMITGEPLPQFKSEGDSVLAGTILATGFLHVKVSQSANDTVLANIVKILSDAQGHKMPIGRFADKVANVFVPSVVIIAVITFISWALFSGDYMQAFLSATAVLVISCPCALGLATPIAIVSSLGSAAKYGMLVKSPEIMEVMGKIKYAIFDKTGTLTLGKISVKEAYGLDDELISLCASIEARSEHPISKAIVEYAKDNQVPISENIEDFEVCPGRGVKGLVDGHEVIAGNETMLLESGVALDTNISAYMYQAAKEGNGVILLAIDGVCKACIVLEDSPRDEAYNLLQYIKNRGITPVMLTGDHEYPAKQLAKKLGIELVYSQVLPTEKFDVIKSLQKDAKVAFIGDGINDAPSLKQADVGIALSSGSDIAKDAGDIVLINNDLRGVSKSIRLAKRTMVNIKQNLFWAFIYNIIGIPLAAGVLYPWYGIALTPMYAGVAMSFSSVTVVLNSLRLKMQKL